MLQDIAYTEQEDAVPADKSKFSENVVQQQPLVDMKGIGHKTSRIISINLQIIL